MNSQPNLTSDTGRHSIMSKSGNFPQPDYFSPADYFLGIVERAISSGENLRITLPSMGAVRIFPESRKYYTDVLNMKAFCEAPSSSFKVATIKNDNAISEQEGAARKLDDLLWQAAFHASRGRLVQSRSNGENVHIYDVIRFHHWPNLTRLPQTPNTMRICALLTRQPSSIMLVSRKLGIDPEEVYQVYSAACGCGIVKVISNHMGDVEMNDDTAHVDSENGSSRDKGMFRSLFSKISGL